MVRKDCAHTYVIAGLNRLRWSDNRGNAETCVITRQGDVGTDKGAAIGSSYHHELAIAVDEYHKLKEKNQMVTVEMVDRLERLIEDLEQRVEMPKSFVIPGNCPSSAVLDVARAVTRRAERRVVALNNENLVPNERVLAYLNRLADLIFTLARYDETE